MEVKTPVRELATKLTEKTIINEKDVEHFANIISMHAKLDYSQRRVRSAVFHILDKKRLEAGCSTEYFVCRFMRISYFFECVIQKCLLLKDKTRSGEILEDISMTATVVTRLISISDDRCCTHDWIGLYREICLCMNVNFWKTSENFCEHEILILKIMNWEVPRISTYDIAKIMFIRLQYACSKIEVCTEIQILMDIDKLWTDCANKLVQIACEGKDTGYNTAFDTLMSCITDLLETQNPREFGIVKDIFYKLHA
tara:strand:- start:326 stop:1090 length:765 start_codon:yes stop_codon:yes gene_type:complete